MGDGTCECGRPQGHCVKGDLDRCPTEDDDDYADDEDFARSECGMIGPGNHCQLRGTEWCDWDCPFSSEATHNRRVRQKLPLFPDENARAAIAKASTDEKKV